MIVVPHVKLRSLFLPAAIPDSQVRPEVLGGKSDIEDIRNVIPEPAATPPPLPGPQQPFDYDDEVYTEEQPEDTFPDEEEEKEEEAIDNQLNPRGDVFSECLFLLAPRS